MNNSFTGWCRLVCLAWVFCLRSVLPMNAADSLVWRAEKNQVDAEIESWPLSEVLESISSATGWQIYLEPDTEYTVTTRFHNLKPADALRRLLGELNFALDRKSTRLNSSHRCISYAVFCLKKKTQTIYTC